MTLWFEEHVLPPLAELSDDLKVKEKELKKGWKVMAQTAGQINAAVKKEELMKLWTVV